MFWNYTQSLSSDTDTAAVQSHHSYLEALVDFAEEVFLRNLDVLKYELAGAGSADTHLLLMGTDAESFHLLLHDQSGDALVAERLVSHTENYENVCIACVCDEDLGAVYQIVVALVFKNSLLTCCVCACVGLSQTESAELLGRYFCFCSSVPNL